MRGTLVLGHGAGGGIESADLAAVTAEAAGAGWRVVRVEQPWRVAGKRVAAAPPTLDEGWRAVLHAPPHRRTSSPARWCSAAAARARGWPAGRRSSTAQRACSHWRSRCTRRASRRRAAPPELTAVPVPLVVVQGETDAFGAPEDVAAVLAGQTGASVYAVAGDHALKSNVDVVAAAALSWLDEFDRALILRTVGGRRPAMADHWPGRSGRVVGWCG